MTPVKGHDLRNIRLQAGKTTVAMAQAAGVKTRKTYENWERNVGTPSVNQFVAMVDFCGFNPTEMLALLISRNHVDELVDMGKATQKRK